MSNYDQREITTRHRAAGNRAQRQRGAQLETWTWRRPPTHADTPELQRRHTRSNHVKGGSVCPRSRPPFLAKKAVRRRTEREKLDAVGSRAWRAQKTQRPGLDGSHRSLYAARQGLVFRPGSRPPVCQCSGSGPTSTCPSSIGGPTLRRSIQSLPSDEAAVGRAPVSSYCIKKEDQSSSRGRRRT